MVIKPLSISKRCPVLFIAPSVGIKDYFAVCIVQDPFCFIIECCKGNGDIEAILVIKNIPLIVIVVKYCGEHVNIFFCDKDINFQSPIDAN